MASFRSVDILLSTYNGEAFLKEQIDSILAQSYAHWRLVARDDGSADSTPAMITWYSQRYPGKIVFLGDDRGRLGAAGSFGRLLEASNAEYSMFSDQDDRWLPEKVELTLQRMIEAEARQPGPVLVHTDLKVTDRDGRVVADSFWRHQRLDPRVKGLQPLLAFNNVTGCTAMMNRALRNLVTPIPASAVLHDWWAALAASAFGRIEHINTPTVLYRQHGANAVGSEGYGAGYFASRLRNLKDSRTLLLRIIAQARAFHERYGEMIGEPKARAALREFASVAESSLLRRLSFLLSHPPASGLRGAALALLLLSVKGTGGGAV